MAPVAPVEAVTVNTMPSMKLEAVATPLARTAPETDAGITRCPGRFDAVASVMDTLQEPYTWHQIYVLAEAVIDATTTPNGMPVPGAGAPVA